MTKNFCISKSWDNILDKKVLDKTRELVSYITSQRRNYDEILPSDNEIFNALIQTDFENVRVLIIGQDPYPNKEDAHGLAFSKKTGELPQSLKNIFKEIEDDIGIKNDWGNLSYWSKQGVLLLNRALTIMKDGNKKNENKLLNLNLRLWKEFINEVLQKLTTRNKPLVIMLWGGPANRLFQIEKDEEYKAKNILILRSSHPSPLGYTKSNDKICAFKGCKHFSKCNEFLKSKGVKEVDWKTYKRN